MRWTHTLALAALAVPALALHAELRPLGATPAQEETAAADTYASLVAEYEDARDAYLTKLSEASREERRELRKQKPIDAFWPRFSALAAKNDGRSLLWLAQNVKSYRAIKTKQRGEALKPIFDALFEHHGRTAYFGEVLDTLGAHTKTLGAEAVRGYIDGALDAIEDPNLRAHALFVGFDALRKEDPKASRAYGETLGAEFGGTLFGTRYRAAHAKASDTETGQMAPDFVGLSIDGDPIRLSDHRGEVVLIDFFGFW